MAAATPSIPQFCCLSLKLFGCYFVAYLIAILAHIPACWALVHDFTSGAVRIAEVSQVVGVVPFYTAPELMSYGPWGELIAASFIALLLGTALFFTALPFCLIVFGIFAQRWPLMALLLAAAWAYLGRAPALPLFISLLLALAPLAFCWFLARAYSWVRCAATPEAIVDDES